MSAPRLVPSTRTALVLVAAGVVGALSAFVALLLTLEVHRDTGFARDDWRVLREVQYHSGSLLVDGAQTLVRFGNVESLLVIAVVVGLLLRWRGLRPILCLVPLASLVVAGTFVQIMKSTIDRAAPYEHWQFDTSGLGSFPSGHSADTMSLSIGIAIVLAAVLMRRPAERVAVFAVALGLSMAVGVSTLVLGVHWPTDVLAGWAIGLGAAVLVGTGAVLATREQPFAP
jgi:membrane-associated phospholipid phosphatase